MTCKTLWEVSAAAQPTDFQMTETCKSSDLPKAALLKATRRTGNIRLPPAHRFLRQYSSPTPAFYDKTAHSACNPTSESCCKARRTQVLVTSLLQTNLPK